MHKNLYPEEKIMNKLLKTYIDRLEPEYKGIDIRTAHLLASLFLAYRFGLYSNVVSQSPECCNSLPVTPSIHALKRAITYIMERSLALLESRVPDGPHEDFPGEESQFLAMNLTKEQYGEISAYVLTNSLLLLYAVAYLTSTDDQESLEEHEKFVINSLALYMKYLK